MADSDTVTNSESVPMERWGEYLGLFTNGNQGRRVSIETISDAADQPMVSRAPLLAIDYGPQGKGDNVVISLGRDTIAASHVVQSPRELWQAQDENGKVVSLQITGAGGQKTIVTLE